MATQGSPPRRHRKKPERPYCTRRLSCATCQPPGSLSFRDGLALQLLGTSICSISSGSLPFWQRSGVRERCRAVAGLADVAMGQPRVAPTAPATAHRMINSTLPLRHQPSGNL